MDKEIVIPKVRRLRREASQKIFDEPGDGRTTKLQGNLESLFSLRHSGISASQTRIIVHLPAVMSSLTSITTGKVLENQKAESQHLLLDSEWFFLDSYPPEIRPYLSTRFSFDVRPRNTEDIIRITAGLLRSAYRNLKNVGLKIPLAEPLQAVFNSLTQLNTNGSEVHPYDENSETKNLYLILAYVLSTLLWKVGATYPLRSYSEPTYPGVIVASYATRLAADYFDIAKKLNLAQPLTHKRTPSQIPGINEIPNLASGMRLLSEKIFDQPANSEYCDGELTRDLAFSIHPALDITKTEPCQFYLNLIVKN